MQVIAPGTGLLLKKRGGGLSALATSSPKKGLGAFLSNAPAGRGPVIRPAAVAGASSSENDDANNVATLVVKEAPVPASPSKRDRQHSEPSAAVVEASTSASSDSAAACSGSPTKKLRAQTRPEDEPACDSEGGKPAQRPAPTFGDLEQLHRKCWEMELRGRTTSIRSGETLTRLQRKVEAERARSAQLAEANEGRNATIELLRQQLSECRAQLDSSRLDGEQLRDQCRQLTAASEASTQRVAELQDAAAVAAAELAQERRRVAELEAEQQRGVAVVETIKEHLRTMEQVNDQLQSGLAEKERCLMTATATTETLKRSYFNAIALAVKMDFAMRGAAVAMPNINLQELYEHACSQCVSLGEYPSWIPRQINMRVDEHTRATASSSSSSSSSSRSRATPRSRAAVGQLRR